LIRTSSSAVTKTPRDASYLSVVSFNIAYLQRSFCRAMRYICAAYAVMRCVCVCLCVTFVSCVKTNKGRRWNTATISQVVTLTSLVVYCGYSTTERQAR